MKWRLRELMIGIGILICISFSIPSYAAPISGARIQDTYTNQISERTEKTKWYYRIVNGVRQKRLWSLTYGYWKTDWINY